MMMVNIYIKRALAFITSVILALMAIALIISAVSAGVMLHLSPNYFLQILLLTMIVSFVLIVIALLIFHKYKARAW